MITNNHDLPEALMDIILKNTPIFSGDYSVSNILDSPYIVALKKANKAEIDASDMMWQLLSSTLTNLIISSDSAGNSHRAIQKVIGIIEREIEKCEDPTEKGDLRKGMIFISHLSKRLSDESIEKDRYITARTFNVEIDGRNVSFSPKLYDKVNKELIDFKMVSTKVFTKPELRKTMSTYNNVGAYIMRQNGFPVEKISAVLIFKDWTKAMIYKNQDYPESSIISVDIKLAGDKDIAPFLFKRVLLHKAAEEGEATPCNERERWKKADVYAVKSPFKKIALKIFDRAADAQAYIDRNRHKEPEMFIEERPGEESRCVGNYCGVAKVCPYWQAQVEKNKQETLNL